MHGDFYMEMAIILEGIEEIGHFFLNRTINKIKIESILAKDYPVNYPPLKIFNVEGNSRRLTLISSEEKLQDIESINDVENKWIKTIYGGAKKAIYRANLEYSEFDSYQYLEVPIEKDIIWNAAIEGEVAVFPDTSALLDGLISRLIASDEFEEEIALNVYLSPIVIREIQNHAEGRQKQLGEKNKNDGKLLSFAEEKRKARIALRALGELVEYRNSKKLRLKLMEVKNQNGNSLDWNILMEAKSLHVDMPKFFITNDLIQSALADLMGLKVGYMYPIHLMKWDEINLEDKSEVGKAIYDLAIQFGEIILETKNATVKFNLQSDWPNKMSPSWINKIIYMKIEFDDINYREKIIKLINKNRNSYEKIEEIDPRLKTLL